MCLCVSREVHDFCTLLGFGADAVCPYLVYETMSALRRQNKLEPLLDDAEIYSNYIIAVANGIAKVMAKMGISTLHSYKASVTSHYSLVSITTQTCLYMPVMLVVSEVSSASSLSDVSVCLSVCLLLMSIIGGLFAVLVIM